MTIFRKQSNIGKYTEKHPEEHSSEFLYHLYQ